MAKKAVKKDEKKVSKRTTLLGGAAAQVSFHPSLKKHIAQKALPHNSMQEHAVVAFGRMNPPSKGHERIINEMASYEDSTPLLFLSKSHNLDNPIPYETRIHMVQEAFGDRVNVIYEDEIRDYLSLIKFVSEFYTEATFIVGNDRFDDVERILEDYNGKEFELDSYSIVSLERDADSDDVELSISASKMRELAESNQFEQFKECLPENLEERAQFIFDDLRLGINMWRTINEEKGLRRKAKEAILTRGK